MVSPINPPAGIPREVYPFESHCFDLGGFDVGGPRMHYLDEGEGPPVLMVHGNPTWSLYYRSLVLGLRDAYRCVVPDHIGMGASDKPPASEYPYTLARRVDDLEVLTESLGLDRDVTLIAHDWGGMIGMAWAARHPERIARLVLMNTAAFPMPAAKRFPAALRLTRTPLGALLVERGNAFAATAAWVCVKRRPLSAEVRHAYLAPYATPAERIATLRFVQDIPLSPRDASYAIVEETASRLSRFSEVPTRIFWGEQDFVFDAPFLDEWRRLMPHAEITRFPDAGHYVLEDEAETIVPAVRAFLDGGR